MLRLVRTFRAAIIRGDFPLILSRFLLAHFGSVDKVPTWVTDALTAVDIKIVDERTEAIPPAM